ncbi:hypothetical protein D3C77_473570 [compost metagenome]
MNLYSNMSFPGIMRIHHQANLLPVDFQLAFMSSIQMHIDTVPSGSINIAIQRRDQPRDIGRTTGASKPRNPLRLDVLHIVTVSGHLGMNLQWIDVKILCPVQ